VVAAHDAISTDKAGTIGVLQKRIKGLDAADAGMIYARLTGPGGFNRKAQISLDGLKTVLSVRSAYGEPKKTLTDPYKYIDLGYYEKAMRGR
jgi:hypothetical protein